MEFRLVYLGALKAKSGKAGVSHKHEIRRKFHQQLKTLWNQEPLQSHKKFWLKKEISKNETALIQNIGDFEFAPLISPQLRLICNLEILLLVPDTPGSIIKHGGDIDNRLKTLLDALRMPKELSEIPDDYIQLEDERLFFCLLEDDKLVTSVSITTDRLLELPVNRSDVWMVINVIVKGAMVTIDNVCIVA